MNVGKQLNSLKGILSCHYLSDLNATKYLRDGEVTVYAHSNGIGLMGNLSNGMNFFYISHKQIIDMKFVQEEQFVQKEKSVVGRAVVGGLLLGPTAAIVGGLSGLGTKVKSLGKYLFVINFWDVYSHQAQSIVLCSKVEGVGFIEKVEEERAKKNIPEGNNYVCNILDEHGNLQDDKIIEAAKSMGKTRLATQIQISQNIGVATAMQKINEVLQRNNVGEDQVKKSGCMGMVLLLVTSMAGLFSLVIAVL